MPSYWLSVGKTATHFLLVRIYTEKTFFKGKWAEAMSYNCIYSLTQQESHFQELILNKRWKKYAFKNNNNNKIPIAST